MRNEPKEKKERIKEEKGEATFDSGRCGTAPVSASFFRFSANRRISVSCLMLDNSP